MKAAVRKTLPRKKAAPPEKRITPAPDQLVKIVQDGLKFDELEALRSDLGLSLEHLAGKLGIARATLHRRKVSGRLGRDESDKV
ncbi:MAG: hypothetical protein M3372_00265, partial [Verrucomicrobiota bacterium]|nr:hypothetical protein [Verrucomicrobiota bacterium]